MKILLTLPDLPNTKEIKSKYTNTIVANGQNYSPEVNWELDGINIDDVKYFNLYCWTEDFANEEIPIDKWYFWNVENISVNQILTSNVFGLKSNGTWLNNTIVNPTTYDQIANPDNFNGWNGPGFEKDGYPSDRINCKLQVVAVLKNSEVYIKKYGDKEISSNIVYFFSALGKRNNTITANSCGKVDCPIGYTWNESVQKCEQKRYIDYTFNLPYPLYSTGLWADFYRSLSVYELTSSINVTLNKSNLNFECSLPIYKNLTPKHDNGLKMYYNNMFYNNTYKTLRKFSFVLSAGDYIFFIDENKLTKTNYIKINDYFINFNKDDNYSNYDIGNLNFAELAFHIFLEEEKTFTIEIDNYSLSNSNNQGHSFFLVFNNDGTDYIKQSNYVDIIDYHEQIYSFDLIQSLRLNEIIIEDDKTYFANYVESTIIPCYYIIKKCNSTEEYKILLKDNETLIVDNVYKFDGNIREFKETTTQNYNCFVVTEYVINKYSSDIVYDVEVVENLGSYDNDICDKCNYLYIFESCDGTKQVVSSLHSSSIEPVENTVYNLSFCVHEGEFSHYEFSPQYYSQNVEVGEFTEQYKKDCECYKFVGKTTDISKKTHNALLVRNYYATDICAVCDGHPIFQNCTTGELITVEFEDITDNPDSSEEGNIFELKGNSEIENKGWIFIGYDDYTPSEVKYKNITLFRDIECKDCTSFYAYLELKNCITGKTNNIYFTDRDYIFDENKTYVFAHDLECCTVKVLPPHCKEEGVYILDKEDILEVYDTCEECNTYCIVLVDCETKEEFKPKDQKEASKYVDRVVKYSLTDDISDLRCGHLYSIRCGLYNGEEKEVKYYQGCYSTCEECNTKIETYSKFTYTQRKIEPGIKSKNCCDNTPQNCCKPKKCNCYGHIKIEY